MQINRAEARYKAMTILYQINLYEKNKIRYFVTSKIKAHYTMRFAMCSVLCFFVKLNIVKIKFL